MDSVRRVSELTAPASEPITLDELKAHLRVSNTADDAWLTAAIVASRYACEDYTGCAFIQRTFRQLMDQPSGPGYSSRENEWWDGVRQGPISVLTAAMVEIITRPVVSVEQVLVWDDYDVSTTVASTVYFLTNSDKYQPARLILRRGQTWPVVLRVADGFQIDFTAGFAATAAGLPADLVMGIKMAAAYMYTNRGDCSCDAAGAKDAIRQSGAYAILDSFRLTRF